MVQKKQNNMDAYKKYTPTQKNMSQRIADKMPDWLLRMTGVNVCLFLWGSILWAIGSNTHQYDSEFDARVGPLVEQRTYGKAFKDAYWPIKGGEYAPDSSWHLNVSMVLVCALLLLAQNVNAANKERKRDLKSARNQIDIMLKIDGLAKEHNLDATAAKKMLTVAPEIVKHMSEDSRVYFDLIMDGKISVNDENFVNIATAVMAGHLQSHPEDLQLVKNVFEKQENKFDMNTIIKYANNNIEK